MAKKNILTKEEQVKAKKQIIHTMECEKLIVSKQDVKNIENILSGDKTVDEVIAEEQSRMREEGLIK